MVTRTRGIPLGNKSKGYSGGQTEKSKTFTYRGNESVNALFLEYTNNAKNTGSWEFISKAVRVAMSVFSRDENWFLSPDLDKTNTVIQRKFLLDTFEFIFTGKRKISIFAWRDLIAHDDFEDAETYQSEVIKDYLRTLDITSPQEVEVGSIIQKWIPQEKGFDDMLFSLHYLFGSKEIKAEE